MGGTLYNNAPKATGQPVRPSTPIPQNVQARYAPQNYRNTPMSIPAPTASGGFNLGDIGSILSALFGMGAPTNQAPASTGNAGYIQQPKTPSMVDPKSIGAYDTSFTRAPIVERPPPPPAVAPEVSGGDDSPPPVSAPQVNTQPRYNSEGSELFYGQKRGGAVKKPTDDVDRALRVVRNVAKKDKK